MSKLRFKRATARLISLTQEVDMKRLCAIASVLVLGIFLMTVALADKDEATDVKAAADSFLAAWNAGDADAIAQHHYSLETSYFHTTGTLLDVFDKALAQAWFDSGGKVFLQPRHRDIKIYGNTAVVTGYLVGTITLPNGSSQEGTWRSSATWMKVDGEWKVVHVHNSPLIATPPQ